MLFPKIFLKPSLTPDFSFRLLWEIWSPRKKNYKRFWLKGRWLVHFYWNMREKWRWFMREWKETLSILWMTHKLNQTRNTLWRWVSEKFTSRQYFLGASMEQKKPSIQKRSQKTTKTITIVRSTTTITSLPPLSPFTKSTKSTPTSSNPVQSCMENLSNATHCTSFWKESFSVATPTKSTAEDALSDTCFSTPKTSSSSNPSKSEPKWDSGYFFF